MPRKAWVVPSAVAGAALLTIGAGAWWIGLFRPWPVQARPDQLCEYVADKHKLECPVGLASGDVFSPGSIVRLDTTTDGRGRVSWPSGSLLGDACLLAGTDAEDLRLGAAQKRAASFETVTYKVDASLWANGVLKIPTMQGLKVNAGTDWKRLKEVSITARQAHFQLLDENSLAQSLSSCSLKPSCVRRIVENQDRVINGILVADGFEYRLSGSDGKRIPVSTGVREGIIGLTLDGKLVGAEALSETLEAKTPVVVGVTLVRTNVLQSTIPCTAEVIINLEGDSRVKVAGGGKSGFISAKQANARFSEIASVQASGSEESECQAGSGRTVSSASTSAKVAADAENKLRFSAKASAQGGHFRTVAACAAGQPIGLTGHDNSAAASALLNGLIRILVRSDTKNQIVVRWSGFVDSARLFVTDPKGRKLIDSEEIRGTGERILDIGGPGLYLVRSAVDVSINRDGEQRGSVAIDATLSAEVRER